MESAHIMVIGIVAVAVMAGVINNYLKVRAQALEANADQSKDDEIAALKKRIEVLEKIAIDGDAALAKKISKL